MKEILPQVDLQNACDSRSAKRFAKLQLVLVSLGMEVQTWLQCRSNKCFLADSLCRRLKTSQSPKIARLRMSPSPNTPVILKTGQGCWKPIWCGVAGTQPALIFSHISLTLSPSFNS